MKKSLSISLTVFIILIIRLVVISRLDVFADEVYYWDWSRFLSGGYFDHPPMVAWLVHLTTSVLGDTYWGIKMVPLFLGLAVTLVTFFFAKHYLESTRALVLLVVLLNGTILYAAGGLILTPDIPFLFFWTFGLWIGYMAIFENNTLSWPFLGLICGFGLLSKYVFVLFIGAFALFLLIDKNYRKLLLSWKPWTAFLVAIVTFLPNVIWNARNEWISYLFQFGHGFKNDKTWPQIGLFFEYLGGQVGLFTPFLFVALVMAVVYYFRRHIRESKLLYLFVFLAVPLLFFGWSSLSARVEANWPAPAFLSGLVLLMWYYERVIESVKLRRYIYFSIGFSVILTALVFVHVAVPFLPIPAKQDRTLDPIGWLDFANDIASARQLVDPASGMPLCANTYQMASLLAFHSPNQPRTWALNLESRTNHYAFLDKRSLIVDDSLLFVYPIRNGIMPKHMDKYFSSSIVVAPVQRRITKTVVDSFAIFKLTLSDLGKDRVINEAENILHQ